MLASISFRIVNWKLTILGVLMIFLLCYLGFWQLNRADEKKLLLESFAKRTLHTPLSVTELKTDKDLRYYRVSLIGEFDNLHTLLLDNKIQNSKVGYEVYTPFIATELANPILVDRGFVPLGRNRNDIPHINGVSGTVLLTGMLNLAPTYVAFGDMITDKTTSYPLRVEYIDLKKMPNAQKFFPYVLMINPKDPAAYDIQLQAFVTMPPERHIGYAVQWFALALTLLILCVVLNYKSGARD